MSATKEQVQRLVGHAQHADVVRSLDGLAEISQTFATSLDIEETLQNAVERIIDYLDAEAASVFLHEEGTNELVCRASAGPVPITGMRLPLGRGIVGRTMESGRCQMVKDVYTDPDFNATVDSNTGFSTRSVMCTALTVQNRNLGVLQVLNKQSGSGLFNEQDLDVLRVLGSAIALAINSAHMAADLMEQRRIREQLELARELQYSLLPAAIAAPFPLVGINLPAYEVSGDFYDYYQLDEHRIGFTIGDVSGKGVNAALMMMRTTTLLRSLGKTGLSLGELLQRVNVELCETSSHGMFVCVLAGMYNTSTDELTLCNAGFPPALLRSASGRFRQLPADAPPLGVVSDSQYGEERMPLAGGTLYMYTDGVSEGRNAKGRYLGVTGLLRMIRRQVSLPLRARMAALVSVLKTLDLRDDTTMLILEKQPPSEQLLFLEMPAQPAELRRMRAAVSEALRTAGSDDVLSEQLVLAMDEACANVIRHAYNNDPKGRIVLTIVREESTLVFRLHDFAPPVDVSRVKPRPLAEMRPGGLGVHFIDTIMDSWGFEPPDGGVGNLLVMKKKLG